MIYVHVPFCRSRCRYCDFYSNVCGGDSPLMETYISGLLAEAESRSEEIAATGDVNTLYIGGGTPSLMPLHFFEKLLNTIPCRSFDEFTLEVNPDDILHRGGGFIDVLKALGVNRISMGVQSLDDGLLKWMGRRHDAAGARDAFRRLRESGFDNISLDVIFGIGGQSMEMLSDTLDGILELGPEHISAYQLSIESGSALAKDVEAGRWTELSDEDCAGQYALICNKLRDAGYVHYEISNWARPGFESRHNSAYWRRSPYVGLGPGAHSLRIEKDRQTRSWNSASLDGWTSESEILTPQQIREEEIMLGLRTAKGCEIDGKRMIIPEDKWFVSDDIIASLF